MTSSPLTGPAVQVVDLIQTSEVFVWMVEGRPDLLALLIEAAEVAAARPSDHAIFFEALAHAAVASDRVIDAMCSGDLADQLPERTVDAGRANEVLGQILKRLCPTAVPFDLRELEHRALN